MIITYNTIYFIRVSVVQTPLNWVLCVRLSQWCHRRFKPGLNWRRNLPPSPKCLLAGLVSLWIVSWGLSSSQSVGHRVPSVPCHEGHYIILPIRTRRARERESSSNTQFGLFYLGTKETAHYSCLILLDWNRLLSPTSTWQVGRD